MGIYFTDVLYNHKKFADWLMQAFYHAVCLFDVDWV